MGRHIANPSQRSSSSPFTSDVEDDDDDDDDDDQFIPIKSDAKRDSVLSPSPRTSQGGGSGGGGGVGGGGVDGMIGREGAGGDVGEVNGNGKEKQLENGKAEASAVEEEKDEEEVRRAMLEIEGHTQEEECRRLKRMGLITALAIGLHNFPGTTRLLPQNIFKDDIIKLIILLLFIKLFN